jgi:hypothetical protein
MAPNIVPVSAILPTRNRPAILARFLQSLALQDTLPAEIVICDGSEDDQTMTSVTQCRTAWQSLFGDNVTWSVQSANRIGLAPQRNQAVAAATQPFVWFLDDDMLLEPGCLRELHNAVSQSARTGGVTATLVNEPYQSPGRLTRTLMRWFEEGVERQSYASACVGPGWTFLHDPSPDAPALVKAEWLGGGCTLYRKTALPVPAVPDHFEGGAFGEDLAASLLVGQDWDMFHVPRARAVHDSQGGDHTRSARVRSDQTLRNRYFIMTRIMGKSTIRDHFDFVLMHAFIVASLLRRPRTWALIPSTLAGHVQALSKILHHSIDG